MNIKGILIDDLPVLRRPILIAGFEGWANALNISSGMMDYLISKLNAVYFARFNPESFYRYDENRPTVIIREGILKNLLPPGGSFFWFQNTAGERDLILLKANEPNFKWFLFTDSLMMLCSRLNVELVITLGSMYGNVHHSDRIITGMASHSDLITLLKQQNVQPIDYEGPGAIHAAIQSLAITRDIQSMSLWCHCSSYLDGITHLGLLSHVGRLLSVIAQFPLDTSDLDTGWKKLSQKIVQLIQENPELEEMIKELKKERKNQTGSTQRINKDDKVIYLKDFMDSE